MREYKNNASWVNLLGRLDTGNGLIMPLGGLASSVWKVLKKAIAFKRFTRKTLENLQNFSLA